MIIINTTLITVVCTSYYGTIHLTDYNHPGDHSGLGGARMGLNDSVNLG